MEPPSTWELQRSYDALRADVRLGFAEVSKRLDRQVTAETLTALVAALERRQTEADERHRELKADVKTEHDRRIADKAADRRLILGAVSMAIGSLVVNVLFNAFMGAL